MARVGSYGMNSTYKMSLSCGICDSFFLQFFRLLISVPKESEQLISSQLILPYFH